MSKHEIQEGENKKQEKMMDNKNNKPSGEFLKRIEKGRLISSIVRLFNEIDGREKDIELVEFVIKLTSGLNMSLSERLEFVSSVISANYGLREQERHDQTGN